MQIIDTLSSTPLNHSVATIGFFDGVHTGHRFLIDRVKREAARDGLSSMLITFPVHPRKVMNPHINMQLLTTLNEKLQLLQKTGVDYCMMLDFTLDLAKLTAREFMEDVLYKQCGVRKLLIGYDHRFGHNRNEGFDDYCRYAAEIGMEVMRTDAFVHNDIHISSSLIRDCLMRGDLQRAALSLGYSYFMNGTVIDGYKVGRKMGFPTANLHINDSSKLIPADGVYAVDVYLPSGQHHRGMLNIGCRPTLENGSNRSVEVHILDFEGDLYNQPLRVCLTHFIRNEQKFDSIEALTSQLHKDATVVRMLSGK